jgi:hypothetical protein
VFASTLKNLKTDASGFWVTNKILVFSIQGPTTPYQVHWKSPAISADPPWPEITHSCTANDGSFADPGVRLRQFTQEFGDFGSSYSYCDDSFDVTVADIASRIREFLDPPCITGTLHDADPSLDGLQPSCTVVDQIPSPGGGNVEAPIAACDANGNTPPCWSLVDPDPNACLRNSHALKVNRGGADVPEGSKLQVSCDVCLPGREPC